MSWNKFLQAVSSADFEWSTRILSESFKTGGISRFAKPIEEEIERHKLAPLRIRDHVLWFLGIESINQALNVTSSDLLMQITDCSDALGARSRVFHWAVELIEEGDRKILQYALEIEDLSSSNFAPLIPDILTKRLEEFQNIRIPRSTLAIAETQRNRYYIGNLWRTAYGRKLLVAIGEPPTTNVIGESKWGEISDALIAIGYDACDLLVDIGDYAWRELNQESEKKLMIKLSGSRELASLDTCRAAYLELDSHNRAYRISALETIRKLDTNSCNRKIAELAVNGSLGDQARAIDILSSTGGVAEEEILSNMLVHCQSEIRGRVAEGISILVSREFSRPFSKTNRVHLALPEDYTLRSPDEATGILEMISRSIDRNARIDAAKSLAHLKTSAAEQILFRMCNDVDPRVRLEIVDLIPDMSHELGVEVIRTTLRDNNSVVRIAAIRIGNELWPEQDWPDL